MCDSAPHEIGEAALGGRRHFPYERQQLLTRHPQRGSRHHLGVQPWRIEPRLRHLRRGSIDFVSRRTRCHRGERHLEQQSSAESLSLLFGGKYIDQRIKPTIEDLVELMQREIYAMVG